MESEKDVSWIAFFKKFSIDFSKAARWGRQVTPETGSVMTGIDIEFANAPSTSISDSDSGLSSSDPWDEAAVLGGRIS